MSVRPTSFNHTSMRQWRTFLGMVLSLLWSGTPGAAEVSEAAVKAVYIYNFVSFVEWPQKRDTATFPTFNICTLGNDEVITLIPGVIEGETLGRIPLQHIPLTTSDSLESCYILYLGTLDDATLSQIRNAVDGRPLLTSSDQPGFAAAGGHIEFGLLRKRVHPIINRRSVEASRLQVSAQLYRLATIVD